MKRRWWITLATVLMLCVCSLGNAESEAKLVIGGENRAIPTMLKSGIVYTVERDYGWFSLIPPVTGKCYIYLNINTGPTYRLATYNAMGEKSLDSGFVAKNQEKCFTFDVKENEQIYLRFSGITFFDECDRAVFSICYDRHHVMEDEASDIREPTCSSEGYRLKRCKLCHESVFLEEVIPPLDHTVNGWTTQAPATCTEPGEAVQICIVCGAVANTHEIPATGHVPGEWQTVFEPACLQSGLRERKCTACGETLESEEIPATGHEYTEWEILYEPTKKTEGERQRHCIHCGDTQQEKIEKIPKFLGIF